MPPRRAATQAGRRRGLPVPDQGVVRDGQVGNHAVLGLSTTVQ